MPRAKMRVPGGPSIRTTTMPRFRRLLPLGSEAPTPAAQRRFEVIRWYEQHGQIVRLTARHFGHSPDTVSRWLRAFGEAQMRGLEDRSRRPVHVRQPTTPTASVLRIKDLREQYPRWGREKLRVLLEREGIILSPKTIDRTLARLRRRGALHEPPAVRKAAHKRLRLAQRPRRPAGLVIDRPGFLQLDSQELRLAGKIFFTFAAVDFLTRKRVVKATSRLTSAAGAQFLERVQQRFPFPVWAVQCDGGHEFRGEFAVAAAAAGITQFTNRPNYPQGNGRVERSFLTDDLEFHEVEELVPTAEGLERQLAVWNHVYEEIRPHQSLGYLTPNQFYAQWAAEHPQATTLLSDMS